MDKTFEKLIEVLKGAMPDTDVSKVTKDSKLLTDLGIDSLNMMLLAITVEDAFNIRFEVGFHPETVGDLCEYIDKTAGNN